LVLNDVTLAFDDNHRLRVYFDLRCSLTADFTDTDEMTALLNKQSAMFHRAHTNSLTITTFDIVVADQILAQLTDRIDFRALHVNLRNVMQHSVLNLVRRAGSRLEAVNIRGFDPDPEIIVALPTINRLEIEQVLNMSALEETHILRIAEKHHTEMVLPLKVDDPNTLNRIIKVVRSSNRIKQLTLLVISLQFDTFFLRPNFLRLEDGRLLGVNGISIPVTTPTDYHPWTAYFVSFGAVYLSVRIHAYAQPDLTRVAII
ncbi:hypothetical protein PFISCL1PPCAC_13963, partial [Pristionchus fissidentatus]